MLHIQRFGTLTTYKAAPGVNKDFLETQAVCLAQSSPAGASVGFVELWGGPFHNQTFVGGAVGANDNIGSNKWEKAGFNTLYSFGAINPPAPKSPLRAVLGAAKWTYSHVNPVQTEKMAAEDYLAKSAQTFQRLAAFA